MPDFRALQSRRAADTFRARDEETLRELAEMHHDKRAYLTRAREMIAELESLLKTEKFDEAASKRDASWDATTLRAEFGGRTETSE